MSRWSAVAAPRKAFAPMSWRGCSRLFLATFVGALTAAAVFILLIDPYGVVPFSLPFDRPIVSSQRQMFPQILRSGRYDAIVVGTSTSRLLDPAALGGVLGGRFASLAMPDATAREQAAILDYFRRTVAAPKAVLVGLDHEWCTRDSAAVDPREKDFPTWAYDGNRWNDFLHLLNGPTLEAAGRTVARVLGMIPERVRSDGFTIFVPLEATYDLARARTHIWGQVAPHPFADAPPLRLSEAERGAMRMPALEWLEQSLEALPDTTRKFLVFPPVHANAMPPAGSYGEARETECKARVAAIARRHGAMVADFRFPSPLTTSDVNFWDSLHYRLPIAYRLIDDLAHIVHENRASADGSYRIIVPATPAAPPLS